MSSVIEVICPECNVKLECDSNEFQIFCPECGCKILIDDDEDDDES